MKNNPCDPYSPYLSGYLDGELTTKQRNDLEKHLQTCERCRTELDDMKKLISVTTGFQVPQPPEEVWDIFLDGVYNRVERRTGWVVLVLGLASLAIWCAYWFVAEPWASAFIKVIIGAPITGLTILFLSVLRERLNAAKTDRYSREVQR